MSNTIPQVTDLQKVEMNGPRDGFGKALLELGKQNRNIVALCADLKESIRIEAFSLAYPDQFVEMGVAEQNMMGMAAGMSFAGKIPFVASYAVFNPGRNWDQLRVAVAYSRANVKVIGAHAGISVGPDGATHQALEDVAITRALPEMTVVVPTDYYEAYKATLAIAAYEGPVYMRFGREKTAVVTTPETPFVLGKANLFREGTDVTICANGPLVYEALLAAELLAKEKISCEIIAVPTVKPLDGDTITASVRKTGAMVTAEEAQITGGLGGAIAELLGEYCPVPLKRIGVQDRFGESGKPDELMGAYGLRAKDIVKAAKEVIKRKKLS